MRRPLLPAEMFPAGIASISTRSVELSTGVRVRVAESGPPDGVPLIMLHGWGASLYMFRHGLAMLPAHGVRTIAVDLRGYGLSDRPRMPGSYTLDAYCADLDALFQMLELPRAALAGQSMGGGLALRYALRRPERIMGLALINPTGLVSIGWVHALRLVPRRMMPAMGEHVVPRPLVGFILKYIARADPTLVTERDIDEYWTPTQIAGFVHAVRATIGEFDWRPLSNAEASSLAVPSVVILGTVDRVVRRARRSAERLHLGRVHSIAGGHCVHEEHPDVVYAIVGEFLERL